MAHLTAPSASPDERAIDAAAFRSRLAEAGSAASPEAACRRVRNQGRRRDRKQGGLPARLSWCRPMTCPACDPPANEPAARVSHRRLRSAVGIAPRPAREPGEFFRETFPRSAQVSATRSRSPWRRAQPAAARSPAAEGRRPQRTHPAAGSGSGNGPVVPGSAAGGRLPLVATARRPGLPVRCRLDTRSGARGGRGAPAHPRFETLRCG